MSESEVIEFEEPEPGQTCAVELFGVENICTHARVSLTTARLIGSDIEGPVHGARFDARSGIVMCRPARRGLRVFSVTRVAGGALISLD